jgi:(p)ppGpp synthase/HD superfamily hydrolase
MNDIFGKKCEEAIRLLVEYMPCADDLIKPTLLHSIRVGTYLYNQGYSQDIVLGGYLHDVIEDTDMKEDFLKDTFGKEVLDIVLANSKNEELEKEERNKELLERCVRLGVSPLIVKIADILDNYKYYKRIESKLGLVYCAGNTEILLNIIPQNFEDKIFEELREFHSKNKI